MTLIRSIVGLIALFAFPGASALADDTPRRVVTGLDATGKAIVLLDTKIQPKSEVPGRTASIDLWTTHRAPAELSSGEDLAAEGAGGTVLRILAIPPANMATLSKLPPDALMTTSATTRPSAAAPHRCRTCTVRTRSTTPRSYPARST